MIARALTVLTLTIAALLASAGAASAHDPWSTWCGHSRTHWHASAVPWTMHYQGFVTKKVYERVPGKAGSHWLGKTRHVHYGQVQIWPTVTTPYEANCPKKH